MVKKGETIFNFILVVFFAVIFGISLTYNPKARLIPLLVSGISLIMSILLFLGNLLKKEKKASLSGEDALLKSIMEKVEVEEIPAEKEKKDLPSREKRRRLYEALFWVFGFVILIYLLGFLVAIPLFTVIFMRTKKEGWLLSLSCAAGLTALVYFAFVKLTEGDLHRGILFQIIGD